MRKQSNDHRRDFIGGSDARIIMGQDEKALIRLWQEKRGEVGPEDLSTNLIVQLGLAEKKFWRCVSFGEPNRLFGVEPPRPRIEAVRIVDMVASNSWAEFAAVFRATRPAFLEHERAKTELKGLMPEDAREAFGHGIRAKRSKSGAVSFEVIEVEVDNAPVQ